MAIDDLAIAFVTMADLAGSLEILPRQVQCVCGTGDCVAIEPLDQFISLRNGEQLLRAIEGFNLGLSLARKGLVEQGEPPWHLANRSHHKGSLQKMIFNSGA